MEKFIHAFNLVEGIGYIALTKISDKFGNFQHAWEKASARDFLSAGLSKDVVQNILELRKKINVCEEAAKLWRKDIVLIGRESAEFPFLLKQIDSPPFLLYRKGAPLSSKMKYIAMVGTRVPSIYGQEMALTIGEKIAGSGGVIVSGLAFGIDAICHHAAIKNNKPTIAVLASGVEFVTPSSHITLAENILSAGGTIISEYAGENVSYKYRFLERNRLISGLCKSTIIIEAAEKSGALITAKHALHQNRDVYALVGDITRPQAKGCLNLIAKSGASPIVTVEELLIALGFNSPANNLDELHKKIVGMLSSRHLNTEEIARKTGYSPQQLSVTLMQLELNNLIRKNPYSKWECVKNEAVKTQSP
jgi:DNA processing protein